MIYVGQNSFRLVVTTSINLAGVSSSLVFLRYKSPMTLSTGQYPATVLTSTAGIIYYDFTSTDSLEDGLWTMWAFVTHADTRTSIGEPFQFTVRNEGDVK
jgi:hypothetical protein